MKLAMKLILAGLAAPVLAACGSGGGDDDVERFTRACLDSSNMGETICACVADKAEQELSPKGVQLLIASMEDDQERTAQLRGEMPLEEMVKAATFFAHAPASCARDE